MKRLPLFLCGLLLVCSADLFAQSSQASRVPAGLPHAIVDGSGAIDNQTSDLPGSLPRARRDPNFDSQNRSMLRAILHFMRIVPDQETYRNLPTRLRWHADPL